MTHKFSDVWQVSRIVEGKVKQTRYEVVDDIVETCHTSENLWVIENFAGFKFCS